MKVCLECGKGMVKGKFCSKKCSAHYRTRHVSAISQEDLQRAYQIELLELVDISQQYGVSVTTVCKYLKKYDIPKRSNYIDFSGRKIGKLQVIEHLGIGHQGGGKHIRWKCRCDCGNEVIAYSTHLSKVLFAQCAECACKARRSELELKNYMWTNIKRGAINRDLEFDIERDWAYELFLRQNRRCALSGVEIGFAECAADYNQGKSTASLDRKDSSKGYTTSNVQWIHKAVNFMKGGMSDADLLEWCRRVVGHADTAPPRG